MLPGIGVNDDPTRFCELRIAPHQPIPVLHADSSTMLGWLGNLSLSGLMIRGNDSFAYRKVHEIRFELGSGEHSLVQLGVQLIWSKSDSEGSVASGFVIRRMAASTRMHVRSWLDQHRHAHVQRSY